MGSPLPNPMIMPTFSVSHATKASVAHSDYLYHPANYGHSFALIQYRLNGKE